MISINKSFYEVADSCQRGDNQKQHWEQDTDPRNTKTTTSAKKKKRKKKKTLKDEHHAPH